MNREFLKSLGLENEAIDKIMAEHGKTVNGTKEELDTVKTERDDFKKQLSDRDTQLKDLGDKVKDNQELTEEINRLKDENKTATQELQDKLDKQAFDFSLDKALYAAKVRNSKAVKALLDTEYIKLDGEKLLGLDDQLKAIKESDPYMFTEEEKQGKPSFSTGQHGKGGSELTADEFAKMSYVDRVNFKKDNPTAYDKLIGQ